MITVKQRGDFRKTTQFLTKASKADAYDILEKYGKAGVTALSAATPKDTGRTASSWTYKIEKTGKGYSLSWHNSNVNRGVNIAVILQYGHGTRNGGYVVGIDYINPALRPVFDKLSTELIREVTGS